MNLKLLKSMSRHPLCVDLDETLVKTDCLVEAVLAILRNDYLSIFMLIKWLFKGRSFFKYMVFRHADLDVQELPYNSEVIDLIKREREQGRPVVLATASPDFFAEKVAAHLGLFAQTIGSSETMNLKGTAKAKHLVERFNEGGFDYVGDSKADLPIWKSAERSFLVNPSRSVEKTVLSWQKKTEVLRTKPSLAKLLIKQIRIHQWTKNLLIFLPIVLSYKFLEWPLWLISFYGFLSFSFMASAVYIVNDLLDLASDRKHPENSRRPFASGHLNLLWGVVLTPILIVSSIALSLLISHHFSLLLLSYLLITSSYSLRLKRVPIADILILASLYSMRVAAGALACGIDLSEWFLIFAIFFFHSLALLKRSSELIMSKARNLEKNSRRGYQTDDLPILVSLGVSSGYLSVLVLGLYISTPEVMKSGQFPMILWGILPFLMFWISRMWLLAYRGQIPADPLVFALKDRLSYTILVCICALWVLSHGF